jgi:hypothetical protein
VAGLVDAVVADDDQPGADQCLRALTRRRKPEMHKGLVEANLHEIRLEEQR